MYDTKDQRSIASKIIWRCPHFCSLHCRCTAYTSSSSNVWHETSKINIVKDQRSFDVFHIFSVYTRYLRSMSLQTPLSCHRVGRGRKGGVGEGKGGEGEGCQERGGGEVARIRWEWDGIRRRELLLLSFQLVSPFPSQSWKVQRMIGWMKLFIDR